MFQSFVSSLPETPMPRLPLLPLLCLTASVLAQAPSAPTPSAPTPATPTPAAQTPATQPAPQNPPPSSGITLKARSQLVIVDVVVTDKHNNPIHGLKAIRLHPPRKRHAAEHT